MKCFQVIITCCALMMLASCSHSNENKNNPSADTISLADKVLTIAAGLPVKKDSADAFFSRLFVPSDSVTIHSEGDFKEFRSRSLTLILLPRDTAISYVNIKPNGYDLLLPLEQLATRMDSAWRPPADISLHKEPRPTVMAIYTDQQQRKKVIEIESYSWEKGERDSSITNIRIRTANPIN